MHKIEVASFEFPSSDLNSGSDVIFRRGIIEITLKMTIKSTSFHLEFNVHTLDNT